MSSLPECKSCGLYLVHGKALCGACSKALEAERDRLREALEWYEHRTKTLALVRQGSFSTPRIENAYDKLVEDGGQCAREALEAKP